MCSEILLSVRKMEDSIQRLKRVRESSKNLSSMAQSTTTATSSSSSSTAILSDDNKIRMQIQTDVNAYTTEVIINIADSFSYASISYFCLSSKNSIFKLSHRIN